MLNIFYFAILALLLFFKIFSTDLFPKNIYVHVYIN